MGIRPGRGFQDPFRVLRETIEGEPVFVDPSPNPGWCEADSWPEGGRRYQRAWRGDVSIRGKMGIPTSRTPKVTGFIRGEGASRADVSPKLVSGE